MEQIKGIYKITVDRSREEKEPKSYIGKSVNILKRWEEHRFDAFNAMGEKFNYPLYNSIRKYGLENCKFEILRECEVDEMDKYEEIYIELSKTYWPNGYNMTRGVHEEKNREPNKKLLNLKLSFGKYKGKTFEEVFEVDVNYLLWILSQPNLKVCHEPATKTIFYKLYELKKASGLKKKTKAQNKPCSVKKKKLKEQDILYIRSTNLEWEGKNSEFIKEMMNKFSVSHVYIYDALKKPISYYSDKPI